MIESNIVRNTPEYGGAGTRILKKDLKKNGQQFDDLPIQSNGMANLIELNGAWNIFFLSCSPAQKRDIDDAYKWPSSDGMVPPLRILLDTLARRKRSSLLSCVACF